MSGAAALLAVAATACFEMGHAPKVRGPVLNKVNGAPSEGALMGATRSGNHSHGLDHAVSRRVSLQARNRCLPKPPQAAGGPVQLALSVRHEQEAPHDVRSRDALLGPESPGPGTLSGNGASHKPVSEFFAYQSGSNIVVST